MKVNREKLDEAIRLRMEPASDHPDSWAEDYCNALMDATGGVYNSLTVGLYGLMDAVRRGLLNDVSSMMNYAMAAEECSSQKYRQFAALAQDADTRAMLETIAGEEDKHLSSLQKQAQSASH